VAARAPGPSCRSYDVVLSSSVCPPRCATRPARGHRRQRAQPFVVPIVDRGSGCEAAHSSAAQCGAPRP
jgi:hypothetical protein